jgi:cob(I)alamin adenosyltransferase
MPDEKDKKLRITRVYTRAGDDGTTGLVGGRRVPKDDPRIEAYGTVDELNAVVGLARTFNRRGRGPEREIAEIDGILRAVQNDLFEVGADLATRAADRWEGMRRLGDDDVRRLEEWCDRLNADQPPLEEFILPGGGPVGAFLHQARTVCRRAERCVVTLVATEEVGSGCLRYLNRLSDLLFVLGRWAARAHGEPEHQWERADPGSGTE